MARYKKLGDKIRRLRKNQSLTQEQLAELAYVGPKTLIELEAGEQTNPTLRPQ